MCIGNGHGGYYYKSKSMNLVHTTTDGGELWLGDYYAASNNTLLKQKNIKAGIPNFI
jgi:hypothetical protein